MLSTLIVDRLLRDTLKVEKPFGGIAVVFGGDPRQILPVVHHGNCPKVVKTCVQSSELWSSVHKIRLPQNMQVEPSELQFSSYLLLVGEGTEQTYPDIGKEVIKVPDEFLVESISHLIVFPDIEGGFHDK